MCFSELNKISPTMSTKLVLSALILISASQGNILRFSSDRWASKWQPYAADSKAGVPRETKTPNVCQHYACPPSQVVEDRGTYEVRYYSVAPYAKSKVSADDFRLSSLELYGRLRAYITGNNDKNETLPMTAPVITRIDYRAEFQSPVNFTMFFYISPEVKSWPTPLDNSVTVLNVNSYSLYVRTFSGYPMTYSDWLEELLQLAADLDADGRKYVTNFFYFASYDNPLKMEGRTNEVQFLVPREETDNWCL